ncbi:GT4 family glycosyltransferase PelF [Bacillus sp. AK031]
MRICIIAEGSYPYIVGGVSSWVQTLITSMPEHEFVFYAIVADEKDKGKYKYPLPENLVEIKEVFLNSYLTEPVNPGKKYNLDASQKKAIRNLVVNETEEWEDFFSLFEGKGIDIDSIPDFITSSDLVDAAKEICMENYADLPFTELYWSLRSMLLPLFWCLSHPAPEADLYHSISTGYAGVMGAYSKYRYNKPFLLTEHGIYTREREEEIIKTDLINGHFKDLWIQYFYSLSKSAYHNSDQVITLFGKNKEIQMEIGCPEEKIAIVPNGVTVARFKDLPGKLPEDKDTLHIGAFVRVVPIKDIKTMIRGFNVVKKTIPHAKLYIFGPYDEEPEYYEECLKLIKLMNLHDVIFTGTVDVRDFMGQMDFLVLSSISEGQPLVLLEGLASGKPFVCTDVGGCKEILFGMEDGFGPAGHIVPVMDYSELAKAMIELGLNPDKREEMGENGRKRVEAHFSMKKFVEHYKAIYGERGDSHGGNRISTAEADE